MKLFKTAAILVVAAILLAFGWSGPQSGQEINSLSRFGLMACAGALSLHFLWQHTRASGIAIAVLGSGLLWIFVISVANFAAGGVVPVWLASLGQLVISTLSVFLFALTMVLGALIASGPRKEADTHRRYRHQVAASAGR